MTQSTARTTGAYIADTHSTVEQVTPSLVGRRAVLYLPASSPGTHPPTPPPFWPLRPSMGERWARVRRHRCNYNEAQRRTWVQVARRTCGAAVRVHALCFWVPEVECIRRISMRQYHPTVTCQHPDYPAIVRRCAPACARRNTALRRSADRHHLLLRRESSAAKCVISEFSTACSTCIVNIPLTV